MKIAFQSKSENPDLTLAERIGRFVLGILEMIPVINYAVCAMDKHLIFKEKISVVVPSTQEEKKLKESEVVTRQTNEVTPTPIKKPYLPSDSQNQPFTPISKEKDISPSEDQSTQKNNENVTGNVIVQIDEAQKTTHSQEETFTDEESSSSEDVLYIVNTKKPNDTPISDELKQEVDDLNLENDETIQYSGEEQSASDVVDTSGEEISSYTSISEESEELEQDNIPSELEHDESFQNSEEEVPLKPEVRYTTRFDDVEEEVSCLESAWKVTKAVTTLAFMFGVGYFIQKQLFGGSSLPPSNPGLDLDGLNPTNIPPVKPPTFDTPIYTPPVFQTDQLDKPKICLLTAYTSDNSERLEMSQKVANNQRDYSEKKGYAYLEYTNNLAVETDPITGATTKWEPYWSKIAAVNKILNNKESALEDQPEWIIWLDDDAVITNPNIKMEDIIAHYTKDQRKELNFFVTTDSMSYILRDIPLNSAVLFIKNNDWSRKFFAKVWEMRKTRVPGQSYTYGNCPHQSCLHEQQAITDLMRYEEFKDHARIIPQRDPDYPVGINTFVRENHIDLNRNDMFLNYNGDNPSTTGREGDFIQQCTGLATRAKKVDEHGNTEWAVRNLRLECINKLLKIPPPKTWSESIFNT